MCVSISSTNIITELVERIPRARDGVARVSLSFSVCFYFIYKYKYRVERIPGARVGVVRVPLAISRECEGLGDEMS